MGFRTGVWNHVCVTWNESTGHQLILVNGQTYVDNSSAFTTWPAGNDLYLGQHSGTPQYWSAFAVFRNFVMWKKEITKAEALSIYNGQKSIFAESYDTGLLFDLDLGDSIAPSTAKNYPVIYDGTLVPTSYAIANPSAYIPYYSDGSTYVGNAPWDTPARPAAPPLNTATNRGMVFEGTMKNYIAAPFSLTAVWALIGTPTRTNNVGDMFGPNFKYGTLVGTAGQGMRRDTGGAAADTSWVFSFWVSVASGTLNGEITLTTATAAETTTVPFTATTTPQQVFVYKQFTGAATGNVRSQFTLTDSGTLRIGGFQLEKRNASQTYNIQAPAVLVPTNFDRLPNYLWYKTAGNINPKVGTAIVWAWLDCDSAKIENSDGPNFISICGDQGQWVLDLHYVSDNLNFSFGGDLSKVATYPMPGVLANVWYQYGISWNMNDVGVGTIKLYLDGAVVATQSITDGILPGWSRLLLGAGMMAQLATDHHKGGIGQFRSWGTQDDSLVLSDWNANRADYGR